MTTPPPRDPVTALVDAAASPGDTAALNRATRAARAHLDAGRLARPDVVTALVHRQPPASVHAMWTLHAVRLVLLEEFLAADAGYDALVAGLSSSSTAAAATTSAWSRVAAWVVEAAYAPAAGPRGPQRAAAAGRVLDRLPVRAAAQVAAAAARTAAPLSVAAAFARAVARRAVAAGDAPGLAAVAASGALAPADAAGLLEDAVLGGSGGSGRGGCVAGGCTPRLAAAAAPLARAVADEGSLRCVCHAAAAALMVGDIGRLQTAARAAAGALAGGAPVSALRTAWAAAARPCASITAPGAPLAPARALELSERLVAARHALVVAAVEAEDGTWWWDGGAATPPCHSPPPPPLVTAAAARLIRAATIADAAGAQGAGALLVAALEAGGDGGSDDGEEGAPSAPLPSSITTAAIEAAVAAAGAWLANATDGASRSSLLTWLRPVVAAVRDAGAARADAHALRLLLRSRDEPDGGGLLTGAPAWWVCCLADGVPLHPVRLLVWPGVPVAASAQRGLGAVVALADVWARAGVPAAFPSALVPVLAWGAAPTGLVGNRLPAPAVAAAAAALTSVRTTDPVTTCVPIPTILDAAARAEQAVVAGGGGPRPTAAAAEAALEGPPGGQVAAAGAARAAAVVATAVAAGVARALSKNTDDGACGARPASAASAAPGIDELLVRGLGGAGRGSVGGAAATLSEWVRGGGGGTDGAAWPRPPTDLAAAGVCVVWGRGWD